MNPLNNISYGLYVVTTNADKYNGCIINTLIQVTAMPEKISITINKDNYTTSQIEKSGVFNISILDTTTNFDLIKHFGFNSGNNVNKFQDFHNYKVATNNIPYITQSTNAYISAKVVDKIDIGTHVTFIAEITQQEVLSSNKSLTYEYYYEHVKPKTTVVKKSYVCKICGYVYEGDTLPSDFICPLCKHGANDFELLSN